MPKPRKIEVGKRCTKTSHHPRATHLESTLPSRPGGLEFSGVQDRSKQGIRSLRYCPPVGVRSICVDNARYTCSRGFQSLSSVVHLDRCIHHFCLSYRRVGCKHQIALGRRVRFLIHILVVEPLSSPHAHKPAHDHSGVSKCTFVIRLGLKHLYKDNA